MGDTGNVLVATVFVRLVLPLVLTGCIAVRPSGLSALYLLLYAYLPFVPNPTSRTVKGHLGRFLKLTLLVTFSTVIGQIVFQIVLLSLPPYGSFLQNCSLLETILRHVGFVRLNNLSVLDILRWTLPDALSLLTAIATHILSSNVQTSTSKNSKILKSVGAYLTLALLLVTSSLIPSIPNFFYYFVFLFGATSWALKIDIKNKCFAVVLFFLYIFVFAHIVAILGFQVQYGRDLIPQAGLIQRLAGLQDYYSDTSCVDPRVLALTENKPWTTYVHPVCLMLLLHLFIYEAKTLLRPEEKYIVLSKRRMGGSTTGGRLGRRQTVRWHGKSRRLSIDLGDSEEKTEETPLMVAAPRTRYGSSGGRSHSGPLESEVLSRGQSVTSRDSCAVESSGEEGGEYDGYTILITGLFSVFDLFAKSSYIATNIIMMAWSITYHSWLTFVLLLWACVLWMFPNQRKAMLYSSPGLVIYAELLLLAQYVFSLDLTDQELPNIIDGVNMAEIGLVKVKIFACYPILVKSLYTLMFWITLRQFVMERKERKATIEDAAQESFRITVTTTTAGTAISELRGTEDRGEATFMVKLGNFVKDVMTKFWIWVVAIMLFVIGLGGEKVVLYRIVYMALFLVFILTFQLSYEAWRKMMYGFWLTVIVYSMLVLVLIYTYQFADIPQYLSNYTGIPDQLQKDIGLEKYDTGSLFVRLLTPTFFVVITVVQLHYFHKDFLKLSEMRRPTGKKVETVEEDQQPPKTLIDELTVKNLIDNFTFYSSMVLRLALLYYNVFSEITWRFLEIHICKIVLFSALLLTVYDKCALHVVLFVGVVNGLCLRAGFQKLVMHISSIYISLLLLVKMIYQIDYIDHSSWDTNCTDEANITNDAVWLGLHKSDDLPLLLSGYIGMILVLTVQAVVNIRQQYERYMLDRVEPIPGILFPDVQRADADKGLLFCIQFLLNHGFHKFGVEITLVTLVSVIGTRLDLFSVLYSFWLIPLFSLRRHKIAKIWTSFILFVAILLPVQYLACVGLPPFLCTDYPWNNIDKQLKGWLFLPDELRPPFATRLIPDFFLLLVACQQKLVFRRNHLEDFPGGSNEEVPETVEENPVPDFLSNRNPTLLDMMKKCTFLYFYWITLGMMFLAGTNRVNLFALGYLVGSFIFLWEGNEFYLRDKVSIVKRWNYLLAYNVFVIFFKSLLQLVGCVFLYSLQGNFCWFVQLCGIACLNKFSGENSAALNQGILRGGDKNSFDSECKVPHDEAGLVWDGVTFAFLIFQRRIFNSFYFFHIRKETEVQAQLASRGAELIEELMQKQIKQQEDIEKEVLEKIKMKMDRIKATHQKGQRPKGPQNHFDAIRSGDYYMFDENDDDDLEMIDSITEEEDEDEDRERPPGVTLSELMSSALKSDMESAAEMARMARRQSEVKDISFAESQGSRRIRRRRFSRRSAMSFKSTAIKKESSDAPLALSDDEKDTEREEGEGGGGGEESEQKEESKANMVRKGIGYIRFGWAFCESIMISATAWLNKFSKDYRHVSMKLAQERLLLKVSSDPLKEFRKSELSVDLVSRKSTEESDLAGSADDLDSKDDLQTVVEKEFRTSDSLDDISLSELQEHCPFVLLIVAIWYVVISHSDLVCYFIVFLNQIKSASLLSLPLPLMVLLWGSLSVPRPTKTFWVTVIAYTEALVVIKYLFQFDFFPWNEKAKQVKTGPFWPPKILGIEQSEKYAVYDVLLLMAVFFHRFMLKSLGLWKNKPETPKNSEEDDEMIAIEEVKASTTLEEMSSQEKSLSEGPSDEIRCARAKMLLQEIQYFDPQVIKLCFDKYLSSIKTFFNQILNLEYKVKSDVYSYMFMCDFFNFLVVIFGFASFGSQTGDVSSYLEENKVPVPFLVMVILQFGLIVVDRALYLRKYILGKFFFQIFLATLVHVAMFFLLPAVTEREFNAALPPQMWYMVKCIYLLFSAYQIRSGYPTRILGNFLCKKYNYVNMFLFKGFMNVPFLFELRALMDWIWTDTSMTLSDWLKLEDIFAYIFQLKCQRRVEKEYPQERGVSKSRWSKYTIGGSSLFAVIAIIWFPLVLFALGNTVGLPNQPTDISLEITVGSYQPIFTMSVQNNSIASFSEGNWNHFKDYIYRLDKVGQNFLGTYEHDDVVRAKLSGNSSSIWSISPPAREKIMQELLSNDTMSMRISWTVSRTDANPTVTPIARGNDEVNLGADVRLKFVKMINRTSSEPVEIQAILPKFLKVQNNGKATVAKQLNKGLLDQSWSYNWDAEKNKQAVLRNLTMILKNSSEVVWWELEEKCTQTEKSNDLPLGDKCQHLNLYIFNEKAFPPTLSFISGGGIISLYTTLVLVASKFVRGFFSGISFVIMFDDMPNVDRIFQLCLDIYLVRESGELALEEDLFAKLIFLYRSPETLIKWTRPKTVRPAPE